MKKSLTFLLILPILGNSQNFISLKSVKDVSKQFEDVPLSFKFGDSKFYILPSKINKYLLASDNDTVSKIGYYFTGFIDIKISDLLRHHSEDEICCLNEFVDNIKLIKKIAPSLDMNGYDSIVNFLIAHNNILALEKQKQALIKAEKKRVTDEAGKQLLAELAANRKKEDSLKNIKDSLYNVSLLQSTLKWRQDLEKSFGKQNAALILRHEVKIGFTEEMCEYALGSGAEITETTTATTRVAHWYYPKRKTTLHFKNGKLYGFTE